MKGGVRPASVAFPMAGLTARAVKRRLKQIQYRPDLVDGCLAATDLIPDS
ncbi:hypothetical protein JCM4814A_80600 [Streptomyces phaeofaciens JCM 4814]|uniref:Uncharacterized protein n=1 Tax=Streptomyces phaeofaciens TaxID=68254 RepID=A0A918HR58_9ACTN|nr:hypothetical protein GCM10010226_81570 [Streptomyces phaeofaciens]